MENRFNDLLSHLSGLDLIRLQKLRATTQYHNGLFILLSFSLGSFSYVVAEILARLPMLL
jgi:hypothetical protein